MNRETIFAALFAKVSAASGFVTTSRKFRAAVDVTPEEMPAMFQIQGNQDTGRKYRLPTKYILRAELWIYAHSTSGDADTPPSTILNSLTDAVEATLAPSPGKDEQTLDISGVERCAIDGTIDVVEGVLSNVSITVIPIVIIST
jgi:hypothetical protein